MKHWQIAGGTIFTAFAMTLGPAGAEVTPEDVWQNWQNATTSYGQIISSTSVARDGDALRVEGAAIRSDDGTGRIVNAEFGTLNFRDLGDGTVEMTMAETFLVTVKMPATAEMPNATDLTITVNQPGTKIIASGTAEATNYAVTSPVVNITIDETPGAAPSTTDNKVQITISEANAKYLVAGGSDAKSIDSSFDAKTMGIVVVGKDATKSTDLNLTATVADLSGTTKGTFLGIAAMENMANALKSGMTVDGTFAYGMTSMDMAVTEPKGPTKIAATAEGGNLTFSLDKSHLSYGLGGKGMAMTLSSPDIPVPEVKITYSEALMNLLMPVSKSDTPEDFSFTTKLIDFSISDEIWAMFDPTGGLPHDPATIVIDTKGKVKLAVDLMDESQTAALGDAPPGELHALDLTALQAKIAGAELTGSGALTFDNSDLTTFQGVPVPTGKIDLKLTGANTLLDKLIALGFIAEDQAMGFRMMAGMFTTAVEGEDTLTSTLEFKDKGFYANGQRLQ